MGLFTGQYSKNMYDPFKRYWGALLQESKPTEPIPLVDADFNDFMYNVVENLRRFRYEVFEDGTPGADHFFIDQSGVSNVNNFEINGGDGSAEGAGRFYIGGMTAIIPSRYEFDPDDSVAGFGVPATEMDFIHRRITGLTDTVLTDIEADYVANELAGRDLISKVDEGAPVTRIAIISNTANTITVAGGLFAVASIGDFYMVAPSTPVGNRTDTVYLDVFLDEENPVEDPGLLHAMQGITGGIEACRRLKIVQQIHVYEGGTYGTLNYTALSGNYHYRVPIAQLNRLNGNPTITTTMITDLRPTVTGYGSSHEVIDARNSAVYTTLYDTLDDRLEFVEDDAKDAHDFIDNGRSDGTFSGGACTAAAAPGFVDYTAWSGSIDGEQIAFAGGTIDLGAFAPGIGYVYVDNTGTVLSAGAPPAAGAILCRCDVAPGPMVILINDWRFWINELDNKNEIVVSQSGAAGGGNLDDIQTAINYALARSYGRVTVKSSATVYAITQSVQVADYGAVPPTISGNDMEIIFEPGAVLEPTGDFPALLITNAERVHVRGLQVLGTNLTNVTPMAVVSGSTDVVIENTHLDGDGFAGDGFALASCTRVTIKELVVENVVETGIEHTVGTSTELHIEQANINAAIDGITFGAGTITNASIRNVTLDGFSGYGIEITSSEQNFQVENITATGQTCAAIIKSDGDGVHISGVDIQNCSCTTAGIELGSGTENSSLKDSYVYNVTAGPAVLLTSVATTVVSNLDINQNSAAQYPIEILASDYVTIENVTAQQALASGIRVFDTQYCTIRGCRAQGTFGYGIEAEDCSHLRVDDCNLIDVVASGGNSVYIHLEGCDYARISKNAIKHTIAGTAYGVVTTDLAAVKNVGVSITDNVIYLSTADFGIYLGGALAVDEKFVVSGNEIYFVAGGTAGIFIDNLIESVISDNVIYNAGVGISTFGNTYGGSADMSIKGNVINGGATGINVDGSWQARVIIEGNIIDAPTVYGITGSILGGPLSVLNNTIESAGSDAIYFNGAGQKIQIEGNSINAAGGDGIQLDGNDECSIIGNGINGSGNNGVYLNNCDGCNVSTNRSTDNTVDGIRVNGGENNVLTGNTCLSNTGHGIHVTVGTIKCIMTGNVCRDNDTGIYLDDTTTCVVCGNACNDNLAHGIYFDNDWGSLTGNVCTLNGTIAGAGNYAVLIPVTGTYNAVSGNNVTASGDPNFDMNNLGTGNGLGILGANNCGTYNTGAGGKINN